MKDYNMGFYDFLPDISNMFKYKKSDIAILLGSGTSINEITNKQIKIMDKYDKWTLNNFIYHPFIIPDFYHLELKYFNFFIFKKRMEEKRELYKKVKFFIANKPKKITLINNEGKIKKNSGNLVEAIGHQHPYIYKYDYCLSENRKENINARYKMKKNILTKRYIMSLTLILELLYKFHYKEIYLYGIDLKDSYYFWSQGNKKKYGKVHHQYNKEHEKKNPNSFHSTYKIKDFIIDFNRRWMLPYGKNIFIGTKNSLLYPKIKYKNILEEE